MAEVLVHGLSKRGSRCADCPRGVAMCEARRSWCRSVSEWVDERIRRPTESTSDTRVAAAPRFLLDNTSPHETACHPVDLAKP